MDLKALRLEAINESNDALREEKVNQFKTRVRNVIKAISRNNALIQETQETNVDLRKELASLEPEQFEDVSLDENLKMV